MNQPGTLHPLVIEVMNDFAEDDGQLRLSVEQFETWYTRLRGLSPAQRVPVTRDLAVLAARFQREARAATTWAVDALMFFAIQLAGSTERAERLFAGGSIELPPELLRRSQAAEANKIAPAPPAGRSRNVDPVLQQQHLNRRR